MEYNHIKVGIVEDRIGIITLNRPEKRNAISIRMRKEISSCLAAWNQETSSVDIVIFTGAGSTFSAGFDLKEFGNPDSFQELLDSSTKYHMDVWSFPKPTIAAVNGPAMGGGFDLTTFTDIRICSESAVFGHPEIKFGAPPIVTPLRWIIGEGRARELCLTGRKINAQEASQIGLVSQVTAPDELLDRAILMSKTILEAPMDTIRFTKAFLCGNSGKGFKESFSIEHDEAFQKILLPKATQGLM
ncbi:MAG: enoyl-CoA hydratase/isomerase family protein [Peptococcaceae bacterium]|nr:enoyl-CoA hydratase/isomerase family protein [Peptococcaceae bacterium]